MVNDKKVSWIPRNLLDKDELNVGFGIKLKLSDLPFIAAGVGISYFFTKETADMLIKIFTFGTLVPGFFFASKVKYEKQDVGELLTNGTIYTRRQIYYKGKNKGRIK